MARLTLTGQVVAGLGQGASFTQLDWVRSQFMTKLGIDPHPGTLNLHLHHPADLTQWADLKRQAGCLIVPPNRAWCEARGYPIRIAGYVPGAIILPDVPGYPETQVEVIAALPLRQELGLTDGDSLTLEISQPLSVQAVIFDVDGTLVDTVDAYHTVAALAAAPHGLLVSRETVRYALNNNHPTFWELVIPLEHPNRLELMEAMKREAMRRWPEVLRQHGRIMPGLRQTLETLQSRGLRLAIMTGSQSGSFEPLREEGLLDFFETVVTGADVTRPKPDPEGPLKGAAALGVEPGQAVYVGDTPTDVRASRAAGMAAVSVLSGAGDSALLSAAGPDWLIYSHARLPEIILNPM
ncbi:MAG: HAD-IA family hydrolase [Anaerolineales bacterium]|nr:HAD-IA family hydrolase [Anaerolineales bacterium]